MIGASGTIALDVGLIAIWVGELPAGTKTAMLVDVLITETVLLSRLAAYANVPAALTATPFGYDPPVTGLPNTGEYVTVSNTRMVLALLQVVIYRREPDGSMAMSHGATPKGTVVAVRLDVSITDMLLPELLVT